MLKTECNVDFSHFKESVVNRRVSRRMVINHIEKMANYATYLQTHQDELYALYSDMLIGVTSFFREPETFEALKELVFPALVKNRLPKEPIRIWIPAMLNRRRSIFFRHCITRVPQGKCHNKHSGSNFRH